jgi:hypothetical protein
LKFDPAGCGVDGRSDENWCEIAMGDAGVTYSFTSDEYYQTPYLRLTNKTVVQSALNSLGSSPSFMVDEQGVGVVLTPYTLVLYENETTGVVMHGFNVSFESDMLRGDVTTLLQYDNFTYEWVDRFGRNITAEQLTTYGHYNAPLDSSSNGWKSAITYIDGAQPTGTFMLTYECESSTLKILNFTLIDDLMIINLVEGMSALSTVTINQWVRIDQGYYQVETISLNDNEDQLNVTLHVSPNMDGTYEDLLYEDEKAEIGIFYSDPEDENDAYANGDQVNGVSTYCESSFLYTMDALSTYSTSSELTAALKALEPISTLSDSFTITRSYVSHINATTIGYQWLITFNRQNGDLNPLRCNSTFLASSSPNHNINCSVVTITDGSLIQGTFNLTNSYPHPYVSMDQFNSSVNDIPWYIESSTLETYLAANESFGQVSIAKSYYVPQTHKRWSGQYNWLVTFTEREGNVPLMKAAVQLTNINEDATTSLLVADEDRTSDLYYTTSGGRPSPVDGNQVGGTFDLTFTDYDGYVWSYASIPVIDDSTNEAISASQFEDYLNTGLFNSTEGYEVTVTRSSSPNEVMGYTYSITFIGTKLGGSVNLLGTVIDDLTGTNTYIDVAEYRAGTQLQGSFQLRFGGYITSLLSYDATADDVASALNSLASISPSRVVVSREGPIEEPDTQIFGYIWRVTFASHVWKDPTVDHSDTSTYLPGNWIGSATTYDATWASGMPKTWGKNVGPQSLIQCLDDSLYLTHGNLPDDPCVVQKYQEGTNPLSGTFTLSLNTTTHSVIGYQGVETTDAIAYNAYATAVESGGDGSSVEEKLEALENVGDVSVTRSEVDTTNGGYTWTITFLYDDEDHCEQLDDTDSLCNAPGDVPTLTFDETSLLPDADDVDTGCFEYGSTQCSKVTILHGDSEEGVDVPDGIKEVQQITIKDEDYLQEHANFTLSFNGTSLGYCLNETASSDDVRDALLLMLNASTLRRKTVTVFDFEDVLLAPNGKIYTIYWHEDGDQPSLAIEACVNNTYDLAATTVRNGTDHNLTVANSHVIDGYVLRDPFITFEVSGESLNGSLVWNADTSDVKDHLEQNGQHYVNVTREVIGQYGSVEYLVWFVYNEGQTPPGTGDVSDLRVIQRNLDSGENNTVVVTEVQKGTTGLSGTFTVDMNSPLGQRTVQFNETEDRLERKLEEMTTIGNVEVRRYMYPSSTSGGWGKQQSTDDTYGGYEWRVRFLENPGSTNGLTFPPGSGDVDGISTTYSSSLNGNSAKTETYMVDGSNPITGEFKLKYEGDEMNDYSNSYAMNVEMETLLEDLDTIGDVTINRRQVIMEQIPGVTAKVYRDGHYVELVYDSDTFEHVDLLNYMAPGDLIRIGGGNAYDVVNNSDSYSYTGASFLDIVQVNSGSPLFKTTEDLAMTPHILPNQSIEVADTTYQITKTGVEVQQVVVMCDISSCNASTLSLSFLHDMVEESTSCLPFTMSASDLKDALEGFSTIDSGDIIVTKESIDEYVSVFKIYFHGSSVFGNVDLIATSSSVHSTCVGSDNMTILSHTIVQGGYTEVQTMHQALDSGSLRTATDDDTCIAWQSSAQTLESLFNSLSAYTDEALPFDGVANDTLIETAIDYPSLFVKVGDTLRFTDSEGGSATAAVTLISQSYVTVDATVRLNGTLSVSIVHEDAVRVRKSGFNNPKQHILSLRVTSDAIIEDDTASSTHYRLRMTDQEDGTQADSSCLPYHAIEDDMLASLNELAMSLDLNRDGLQNDDGHFLVS